MSEALHEKEGVGAGSSPALDKSSPDTRQTSHGKIAGPRSSLQAKSGSAGLIPALGWLSAAAGIAGTSALLAVLSAGLPFLWQFLLWLTMPFVVPAIVLAFACMLRNIFMINKCLKKYDYRLRHRPVFVLSHFYKGSALTNLDAEALYLPVAGVLFFLFYIFVLAPLDPTDDIDKCLFYGGNILSFLGVLAHSFIFVYPELDTWDYAETFEESILNDLFKRIGRCTPEYRKKVKNILVHELMCEGEYPYYTVKKVTLIINILGQAGDAGVIDLLTLKLSDSRPGVFRAATVALQNLGATKEQMFVHYLKALSSKDDNARLVATENLGRSNNISAIKPLAVMLGDPQRQIRRAAAVSLQNLGVTYNELLEGHLAALGSEDPDARSEAARALGELGDRRAVEPLSGILSDVSQDVRRTAAEALGEIGDNRAIKQLLGMFTDQSGDVRKAAHEALRKLGVTHDELLEGHLTALGSADPGARSEAARALGELGDNRAIKQLLGMFTDQSGDVRAAAHEALRKLGVTYNELLEGHLAALGSEDPDARSEAARALGELGDRRAVEPLSGILSDVSQDVRRTAAEALGEIGDNRAIKQLLGMFTDQSGDVRKAAHEALRKLGVTHDELLEGHLAALGSEDPDVRSEAARALGELGDRRAVEPLFELLFDATHEVRRSVAGSLQKFGIDRRQLVDVYIKALSHRSTGGLNAAAEALGELGDSRAVEPLCALLNSGDAEVFCYTAIANALGELGDARAIKPLKRFISRLSDEERNGYPVTKEVSLGNYGTAERIDYYASPAEYVIAARNAIELIKSGDNITKQLAKRGISLNPAQEEFVYKIRAKGGARFLAAIRFIKGLSAAEIDPHEFANGLEYTLPAVDAAFAVDAEFERVLLLILSTVSAMHKASLSCQAYLGNTVPAVMRDSGITQEMRERIAAFGFELAENGYENCLAMQPGALLLARQSSGHIQVLNRYLCGLREFERQWEEPAGDANWEKEISRHNAHRKMLEALPVAFTRVAHTGEIIAIISAALSRVKPEENGLNLDRALAYLSDGTAIDSTLAQHRASRAISPRRTPVDESAIAQIRQNGVLLDSHPILGKIIAKLKASNLSHVVIIGGVVRDILLGSGTNIRDVDLTIKTTLTAEEQAELAAIPFIPTGPMFARSKATLAQLAQAFSVTQQDLLAGKARFEGVALHYFGPAEINGKPFTNLFVDEKQSKVRSYTADVSINLFGIDVNGRVYGPVDDIRADTLRLVDTTVPSTSYLSHIIRFLRIKHQYGLDFSLEMEDRAHDYLLGLNFRNERISEADEAARGTIRQ